MSRGLTLAYQVISRTTSNMVCPPDIHLPIGSAIVQRNQGGELPSLELDGPNATNATLIWLDPASYWGRMRINMMGGIPSGLRSSTPTLLATDENSARGILP
jgi:hypothetical protein